MSFFGRTKGVIVTMKQKYTITVADMDLNIISDASPDEVENIVGMLDRRMRDINLKSPRCTKNEAALLCARSPTAPSGSRCRRHSKRWKRTPSVSQARTKS